MNKTWQLRVCALYLTLAVPLAASCAREANTLESSPDDPDDGASGSSADAGSSAKAGSSSGKAGATGAFGGTVGQGGSGGGKGGAGAQGGDMASEGGEASVAGSAGSAGSNPGGSAGSGGIGGSAAGGGGAGGTGVPPDVLARASAIVYYQTSHAAASDSTIQMKLYIKNQSPDPLPMANVKIRYWFTAEVTAELHQYYTGPEAKSPKAVFVNDGANSHALMTFGGGSIVMGGDMNASEVQLEMTNNSGKFNQADDFSWAPSSSSSTPNGKITLYLDDQLIWGCEPSGACFDDAGAGGAGNGSGGAP